MKKIKPKIRNWEIKVPNELIDTRYVIHKYLLKFCYFNLKYYKLLKIKSSTKGDYNYTYYKYTFEKLQNLKSYAN